MTAFDNRDKGFENKFAHDEELLFKITAICNKMLGMWAAAKMGKTGTEAEDYATALVESGVAGKSHAEVEAKLIDDMKNAGIIVTPKELRKEIARLMAVARNQVNGHTS